MAGTPICVNPIAVEEFERLKGEMHFTFLGEKGKIENMNQLLPYTLDFEPLSRCAGSCKYCFASSDTSKDIMFSKEKMIEILDQAYEVGIRTLSWTGGDPLLYPYLWELLPYAYEKGMKNYMALSGIISKKDAKRLVQLGDVLLGLAHHLSTVNPEAYAKAHYDPSTLELKKQGYINLLEAGYPQDKIMPCITLHKPGAETIEETLDWYVDEMGTKEALVMQYKPEGFGKKHPELEPSLSDVRHAAEYRAKKLGKSYLRFGSGDADKFVCRTIVGLTYNGDVIPCLTLQRSVGNVYKEPFKDIVMRERETLLYNFEVEGYCKECENSDVCWGCRTTAAHYTGNIKASDPKCWLNPDNAEYCLPGNIQ